MESSAARLNRRPSLDREPILRKEGEYWTIVYDGVVCRLKDTRGLQHLAYLLRHPGTRISAVELHAATGGDTDVVAAQTEPRSSPSAERARLAVTKAIKAALAKIGAQHPTLAQHLSATIRRGHFCSYTPDPRYPITWQI